MALSYGYTPATTTAADWSSATDSSQQRVFQGGRAGTDGGGEAWKVPMGERRARGWAMGDGGRLATGT